MANLKISKRHIVTLWYETQMGPMKRCMEAQAEFAEMMWALYEDIQPEVFDADEDCRKYHEEQDHIAMEKAKVDQKVHNHPLGTGFAHKDKEK